MFQIKAAKFLDVMRNVMANNDEYTQTPEQHMRAVRYGVDHVDVPGKLMFKDIAALRRTCHDLKIAFFPSYREKPIAAGELLYKVMRSPVSKYQFINNIKNVDYFWYQDHGQPRELADICLSLTQGKWVPTETPEEHRKRQLAMLWFASMNELQPLPDHNNSLSQSLRCVSEMNHSYGRRATFYYDVRRNIEDGSFLMLWNASGSLNFSVISSKLAVAAKASTGKAVLLKTGVVATKVIAGGYGLAAAAAVYGTARNIYTLMCEAPDIWHSQFYRDALTFYLMSRHHSFLVFDPTMPEEDLFGDGWAYGRCLTSPFFTTVTDLYSLTMRSDKAKEYRKKKLLIGEEHLPWGAP